MPFSSFILWIQTCTWIQKNNIPKKIMRNIEGKEAEFDLSQCKISSCITGKASESASFMKKGSITVEAVICIPIFLYAAIALIWLLEIRSIQTTIRCGMHAVGKQIAECTIYPMVLWEENYKNKLINIIGNDRLERSAVVGGSAGIDCSDSYVVPGSGIYELKVKFAVKLPLPYFGTYGLQCEESMRIKGWNGYVKELFSERADDRIVYVTETGIVYHLDYHCTYLEPSVRSADMEDLSELRNENGGKYYQCPLCVNKKDSYEKIYITSYGYRYHGNMECPGIQRNIRAVLLSETKGKAACSKCGN